MSGGGFVPVGRTADFRDGRGRVVEVGGEKIAVFRRGDRFFALQDACPHMGASLADGTLVGDRVRCLWHEWTFDLATGESDMRSWACARTFEVRVDRGRVLVRRPEPRDPAGEPRPAEDELIEWDPQRFFRDPGGGEDR